MVKQILTIGWESITSFIKILPSVSDCKWLFRVFSLFSGKRLWSTTHVTSPHKLDASWCATRRARAQDLSILILIITINLSSRYLFVINNRFDVSFKIDDFFQFTDTRDRHTCHWLLNVVDIQFDSCSRV